MQRDIELGGSRQRVNVVLHVVEIGKHHFGARAHGDHIRIKFFVLLFDGRSEAAGSGQWR
tara:strand:- start:802 stop:981 length:180 start_codon:yes stop_codon:yes gene_type:complete